MLHHTLPPHSRPFISRALTQKILHGLLDVLGVGLCAVALCLVVCLASYDPSDLSWNVASEGPIHNLCGILGSYIADALIQLWGYTAYISILDCLCLGVLLMRHQVRWFDFFSGLLHVSFLCLFGGIFSLQCGIKPHVEIFGTLGYALPQTLWNVISDGPFASLYAWIITGVVALISIKLTFLVTGMRASLWTKEAWSFLGLIYHSVRDRLKRVQKSPNPERVTRLRSSLSSHEGSLQVHLEAIEEGSLIPLKKESKTERSLYRKIKSAVKNHPSVDQSLSVYELPPLDCLSLSPVHHVDSRAHMREAQEKAQLLESVLKEFGVLGSIVQIRPGPVVTLYELRPAPGTKSSRVVSLADDIARSMSALSARVAPIPGRDVIGIELPNSQRETVFIRDILSSKNYEESQAALALILGKDIGGEVVIADLARMPHLLVAGTTGSGKSVAVNSMILSLLYRMSPHDCKFLMIDPKMLELSIYDGIPHLLAPVVTDPKKAITALRWVVKEMENRYRAMSQLSVRNITGYNQRVREAQLRGDTLSKTVQTGFDPESGDPIFEDQVLGHHTLPYIVVVVDEMADLMLVAGKEIEAAVQRLAQMARAAGIHIIMATQRPSVDVITGTIKANFPTRISFQVTSKIDSRTILSEQGAEQLLGQGDMLYMASGGRIVRLHGPFVHDTDVERIVAFLRSQGEPDYIQNVTEEEPDSEIDASTSEQGDALYQQALELVRRTQKASTSFIQRHLQIGYNRAARITERMEQEGVITQANHAGKREVIG